MCIRDRGDIAAAGGWSNAQGYNVISFAGVGSDYQVLDDIKAMYKANGEEPPKEMAFTTYYNRGVFQAAVHLKAIEIAVKAKGSADINGTDVRDGLRSIQDFSLGGMLPPLQMSAKDHEGGGFVRVFQVKGDGYVPVTEWFNAYREIVFELITTH